MRRSSFVLRSGFELGATRVHGTHGLEVRLFPIWSWQLRFATTVDYSRDYMNLMLGIGFWH